MNINEIAKEIHQNNVEKGFWDDKETKNVGEVLMLCVSELSEALEAHRNGKRANLEAFNRDIVFASLDDEQAMVESFKKNVKDSFEDEIADTMIRLMDISQGFDFDLEKHIQLKLAYNKTRPYKHNKAY